MDEIIDLLDAAAKAYPVKALCSEIGKAESTLRNELCRQPGYKLGLVTAVLIMKHTGDRKALDKIEGLFNRLAFDVPTIVPADPKPLMKHVAILSKEFSEAVQQISFSMDPDSPGGEKITADEIRHCCKELRDLIAASLQLKAYFQFYLKESQGGKC